MSFSFNFELTEEDSCETQNLAFSASEAPNPDEDNRNVLHENAMHPAFEVKSFYDDSIISKLKTKTLIFNEHPLVIVDTSNLEHLILEDENFKSLVCKSTSIGNIVKHSDLEDGVYEGGLKVWECGMDLAMFLSSNSLNPSIEIADKRVLELGCGAGLPGLYCVKCGAKQVDFQDYNVEVLKLLTHTNVENNVNADNPKTVCCFYAGDWEALCELDNSQTKYDLILSAETIYNVENYPKLHKVLDKMLAPNGVIFIAAKVYYFGVGGSVDAFLEYLIGQNVFDSETVWETHSGVPRKILKLTRQKRNS